jgi:hypothetical protein
MTPLISKFIIDEKNKPILVLFKVELANDEGLIEFFVKNDLDINPHKVTFITGYRKVKDHLFEHTNSFLINDTLMITGNSLSVMKKSVLIELPSAVIDDYKNDKIIVRKIEDLDVDEICSEIKLNDSNLKLANLIISELEKEIYYDYDDEDNEILDYKLERKDYLKVFENESSNRYSFQWGDDDDIRLLLDVLDKNY